MSKNENRKYYNSIKEFNGQKYSGMTVGGKHSWNYNKGIWNETKIMPNKWKFDFTCNKYRNHQAPPGTGAPNKTEFHWYIIADQKVVKIDENTYQTVMEGLKYKVAHKRPNFKYWSYVYRHQSYEDKIIEILEETLKKLKAKKKKAELMNFF
ncbi:MAG: hypothetical protein ACFFDN_15955 [Candidatus Hodarchaeota archaeon]